MRYLLYNPISGHGKAEELARIYALTLSEKSVLIDMTAEDALDAIGSVDKTDSIVIFGGDGTLNYFVNHMDTASLSAAIFYYPAGTGNDFFLDIHAPVDSEPVEITKYLHSLPTVTYKSESKRFLNGVGYGIDGYCCEVGDKVRETGKSPDYTAIAVSGLLFHYKPTSATVTVDGVEHRYEKVWLAPTMFGAHYGGGMNPTPRQSRENDKLSVMVFHDSGKLKTLTIFPSIFKGEHIKHTKYVEILEGKEIKVAFDRPSPMQIDGETVLDVEEYFAAIG